MEKQIVIFFNGHFKIENESVLANEFDIDFDGNMMVKFLYSTDGSYTAVNGIDGWGESILSEIAFKEAQIFYSK